MKKSSKEQCPNHLAKRDEDEILGSPLDNRLSSDEELSRGDSPAGEDDHEWLGRSVSEEVSDDDSDWDSD